MGLLSLLARRSVEVLVSPRDRRVAGAARCAVQQLEDRTLFAAYTVIDLGTLGGTTARAVGVNDTAQAAVNATQADSTNRAARFSGSTLTDIGSFLGPDSLAYGINSAGHVVGAAPDTISGSETNYVGFIWDGSTKTRIGRLAGGSYSVATALNGSDTVVGYAQSGSGGPEHAVVWSAGTLTDLGTLSEVGADYSHANAINASGQIAGESDVATGERHAFLRSSTGTMIDLGTLSGGDSAAAYGINDGGTTVGISNTGATETKVNRAFYYDGTLHDMGTLVGDDSSGANDVNNNGQIVGYSATTDNFDNPKAFLYTVVDGMQDLNTLIPDGSGWTLQEAKSISDTGYIVGYGILNGVERAFMLRPTAGGPSDATPPVASAPVVSPPVEGSATTTVTVTYTDETAILASSIDVADLSVTGPVTPTLSAVSITPTTDSASIIATYTLTGPGGTWDSSDNGNYTITVLSSAVTDTALNAAPTTSSVFAIAFGTSTVGPAAIISTPADITAAGASPTSVTVTYTDTDNVSFASLGVDDIAITGGPDGSVPITGFTASPSADATSISVTYSFTPPGGSWDSADNDAYAINVNGAVTDALGNSVIGTGVSFNVDIPAELPAPDPSFNAGQPLSTGFVAEASVTDLNGKIYVAGHVGSLSDGSSVGVLKRYNPDGSPDAKFGNGGQVVSITGDNDAYYNVALDPAGKFVVVSGARGSDFLAARFDVKKGKIDSKFGVKGLKGAFVQDLGGSEVGYGLAAAADGSLYLSGGSLDALAWLKLNKKGQLEPTFGTNGQVLVQVDGPSVVSSLVIQPDGFLLAAGDLNGSVFVTRLSPEGSIDGAFNGGVVNTLDTLSVRTDLGGPDRSIGLARQADGKVLIANRTATGTDFGVVRLDSAGILDTTFGGGDGIATVDLGGTADDSDSVQVQGTGQIIVTGTTNVGGTIQSAVVALDATGAPITTFANAGVYLAATSITGGASTPAALVVGSAQPGGKLVLLGTDALTVGSNSSISRLNIPGSGLLGQAGRINGKTVSLAFTDSDGTLVTISTKNATATAYYDGSVLDLVLAGTTTKSTVSFKTKDGDGRVRIGNISTDGGLSSFSGKSADISGTFFVNGELKTLDIGTLNGTLASSANMGSLTFRGDLAGAKVLAGINLGADAAIGGGDDLFGPAIITKISVGNVVTSSVVGAGFNPVDGDFFNGGTVTGGAASIIKSIAVKRSTDVASRFFAGAFGKIKAPEKVTAGTDVRFQIL